VLSQLSYNPMQPLILIRYAR